MSLTVFGSLSTPLTLGGHVPGEDRGRGDARHDTTRGPPTPTGGHRGTGVGTGSKGVLRRSCKGGEPPPVRMTSVTTNPREEGDGCGDVPRGSPVGSKLGRPTPGEGRSWGRLHEREGFGGVCRPPELKGPLILLSPIFRSLRRGRGIGVDLSRNFVGVFDLLKDRGFRQGVGGDDDLGGTQG